MDPSTAPAGLWALPSWLLNQAAQAGNRLVGARLGRSGLRTYHFSTLLALGENGPASQAELGRRLWMDRSDTAEVVADLERAGYVSRRRDPTDLRRNVVALTPDGGAALERLAAEVARAQDELLAPLAPEEREALVRLLTRVVEHHRSRQGA
jgi:DNA-binding MarR family transcriptional regulator